MKKLVLFILIGITLSAQTPDPNKIVKEVKAKFDRVKDYVVDVKVKMDIPFFKMPERNMKIYFKKPDKTHIESKEFSVLPRTGLNFNPTELLKGDYTSVYLKGDIIDNKKVDVLNLIPQNDSAKVKYVKLWVDSQEKIIRKFELAADNGSSVKADLIYGNEIQMGLPSQIKFYMDFGNIRIPNNEMTNPQGNKDKKQNNEGKGSVTVTYSNFIVNKGIDDKVFKEKKK